jgi:putative transport protein
MEFITNLFLNNPLILLFTVIGLGYLLGNIKIFGFSLGVSAVLFVGIAFGAVNQQLDLPEYIYIMGLVLFVYAIGLQSGPGFFSSFQKRGLKINFAAVIILILGAALAVVLGKLFGFSVPSIAGLYCGALTNTPALAASVETIKHFAVNLPTDVSNLYISSPVVTYGLAYPFGVLGVIFWFYFFSKVFKINFTREESERMKEYGVDKILSRTFRVINPAMFGRSAEDVLNTLGITGFVLSRIKKGDQIDIVAPDTVINANDEIVAVGNTEALECAMILFGEECKEHMAAEHEDISYNYIFVSNKKVVGKTVSELQLQKQFDATITRVRRGDVDFIASPETILDIGDRILVVSKRVDLGGITKYFGDSLKSISETDFLSLSLGIVLGVFLGMVPIPLPNGMTFKLGFAGGPLVVSLILGRLERTGPITWGLPFSANLVLRQIGLVFFLAAIGIKAGHGFGDTFQVGGWSLIVVGAMITSFVVVLTVLLGYKYFKLPMSAVMGMMSGMQTQPALLAYSTQQTQNDVPNIWYATVYPASMMAKIILAQVIISIFLSY